MGLHDVTVPSASGVGLDLPLPQDLPYATMFFRHDTVVLPSCVLMLAPTRNPAPTSPTRCCAWYGLTKQTPTQMGT